jgi:hypothetical protein
MKQATVTKNGPHPPAALRSPPVKPQLQGLAFTPRGSQGDVGPGVCERVWRPLTIAVRVNDVGTLHVSS